MSKARKILVVDDEEFNLKILVGDLEDAGYDTVQARDGKIACDILKNNSKFDAILLDRMMPNMDGMQALNFIKEQENLKHIPVIMQTAAASTQQVLEGIEAGVFYYLTKPYEIKVMLAVVKSALEQDNKEKWGGEENVDFVSTLSLMEKATFKFQTMQQTYALANFISSFCPRPMEALFGISSLMLNAIEHGNLEISFEEKTNLLLNGTFIEEVERKQAQEPYKSREAFLHFQKTREKIEITIEDQGKGFNWHPFLELSSETALLPNGRGIAMSKTSFSSMQYMGVGNKVKCTISI